MKTNFTLNDLFLYHYNEMSYEDSQVMKKLIASDATFNAESNRILEMKDTLNSEQFSPSPSSIQFILDHDRKSSEELAY